MSKISVKKTIPGRGMPTRGITVEKLKNNLTRVVEEIVSSQKEVVVYKNGNPVILMRKVDAPGLDEVELLLLRQKECWLWKKAWIQLIIAWWDKYKDKNVTVYDLLPITEGIEHFPRVKGDLDTKRIVLGKIFMQMLTFMDNFLVMGTYQIVLVGEKHGVKVWRLRDIPSYEFYESA